MNYKSILKVVGVVSAAAVFSIGCGNNDDDDGNGGGGGGNGGGGGSGSSGLVGDWSMVENRMEMNGVIEFHTFSDDNKGFISFKSSNDVVETLFNKISDFWIEETVVEAKYNIKGDSVCINEDGESLCTKYSISGNTLTMSYSRQSCHDGECHSYSGSSKSVRANLASTRSSLGSSLKSRDPALNSTSWRKSDSENGWEHIRFYAYDFSDSRNVYISYSSLGATWCTEGGNRLTLITMKCDKYETVKEDDYEWQRCTSTSADKIVTLDYQLTNGTLRLRPTGSSAWDTWTPDNDDDNYMSKARAKSKKDRRHVNPFTVFWK